MEEISAETPWLLEVYNTYKDGRKKFTLNSRSMHQKTDLEWIKLVETQWNLRYFVFDMKCKIVPLLVSMQQKKLEFWLNFSISCCFFFYTYCVYECLVVVFFFLSKISSYFSYCFKIVRLHNRVNLYDLKWYRSHTKIKLLEEFSCRCHLN